MRCNVRYRKEVINTSCVDIKKEIRNYHINIFYHIEIIHL